MRFYEFSCFSSLSGRLDLWIIVHSTSYLPLSPNELIESLLLPPFPISHYRPLWILNLEHLLVV
jgi:hypothetical protein